MKNVAIIGAGLQASRRAPAIVQSKGFKIRWVVDNSSTRASSFAAQYHAKWDTNWKTAVSDPQVDIVLVLTYPDSHAEIAIEAMRHKKDVLCEKPLARTEREAQEMVKVARLTERILKCGFNHRHHPAIAQAFALFKKGKIGKAVFGRGRYGIIGRAGLEKEWRSDPGIASGGQLMEQGIHLVDLFCWFLGPPEKVFGYVGANYWSIAPLEDNAQILLKHKNGVISSLHSSLTQWINLFEFEIYGEKGGLTVSGLGGSYGIEKLIISHHRKSGPFEKEVIEFRGHDISWDSEWREFARAVSTRQQPWGNGQDGLLAMKVVNAAYSASKSGQEIALK